MNAVIDEDLPRSFARTLSNIGFTVFDIRDHGLRGQPDSAIFDFAQNKSAILFSADLGFSNILHIPLGNHHGICILRFPNEIPISHVNEEVAKLLQTLSPSDYKGNLLIISPGKLRIRKALPKH